MPSLCEVEINPRIIIWGAGDRVIPLLERIDKSKPVCWAYRQQEAVPGWFDGETIWGAELHKLEGSYGQFNCQLSEGQEIAAGAIVLCADTIEQEEPVVKPGQSVALLLSGTSRGIFARALELARRLVINHQVYVITDDVQVGYPGGEAHFAQARGAGVIFFRTTAFTLAGNAQEGFELGLPSQNTDILVDQIIDYRSSSASVSWPRRWRLGPVSVSGILNTRREGIYVFPAASVIAPTEETLLYDALAARLTTDDLGPAVSYQVLEIDSTCCALCLTCYRICPHQAVVIKTSNLTANLYKMVTHINPAACQRCGSCCAICPARAIKWDAKPEGDGFILACENSGWGTGLDQAASVHLYPCAAAISNVDVMQAMAAYGRVIVHACRQGSCRHQGCAPELEIRLDRLRELLEQSGIAADIRVVRKSAAEIGGGNIT